jgi:hypothetical protein
MLKWYSEYLPSSVKDIADRLNELQSEGAVIFSVQPDITRYGNSPRGIQPKTYAQTFFVIYNKHTMILEQMNQTAGEVMK